MANTAAYSEDWAFNVEFNLSGVEETKGKELVSAEKKINELTGHLSSFETSIPDNFDKMFTRINEYKAQLNTIRSEIKKAVDLRNIDIKEDKTKSKQPNSGVGNVSGPSFDTKAVSAQMSAAVNKAVDSANTMIGKSLSSLEGSTQKIDSSVQSLNDTIIKVNGILEGFANQPIRRTPASRPGDNHNNTSNKGFLEAFNRLNAAINMPMSNRPEKPVKQSAKRVEIVDKVDRTASYAVPQTAKRSQRGSGSKISPSSSEDTASHRTFAPTSVDVKTLLKEASAISGMAIDYQIKKLKGEMGNITYNKEKPNSAQIQVDSSLGRQQQTFITAHESSHAIRKESPVEQASIQAHKKKQSGQLLFDNEQKDIRLSELSTHLTSLNRVAPGYNNSNKDDSVKSALHNSLMTQSARKKSKIKVKDAENIINATAGTRDYNTSTDAMRNIVSADSSSDLINKSQRDARKSMEKILKDYGYTKKNMKQAFNAIRAEIDLYDHEIKTLGQASLDMARVTTSKGLDVKGYKQSMSGSTDGFGGERQSRILKDTLNRGKEVAQTPKAHNSSDFVNYMETGKVGNQELDYAGLEKLAKGNEKKLMQYFDLTMAIDEYIDSTGKTIELAPNNHTFEKFGNLYNKIKDGSMKNETLKKSLEKKDYIGMNSISLEGSGINLDNPNGDGSGRDSYDIDPASKKVIQRKPDDVLLREGTLGSLSKDGKIREDLDNILNNEILPSLKETGGGPKYQQQAKQKFYESVREYMGMGEEESYSKEDTDTYWDTFKRKMRRKKFNAAPNSSTSKTALLRTKMLQDVNTLMDVLSGDTKKFKEDKGIDITLNALKKLAKPVDIDNKNIFDDTDNKTKELMQSGNAVVASFQKLSQSIGYNSSDDGMIRKVFKELRANLKAIVGDPEKQKLGINPAFLAEGLKELDISNETKKVLSKGTFLKDFVEKAQKHIQTSSNPYRDLDATIGEVKLSAKGTRGKSKDVSNFEQRTGEDAKILRDLIWSNVSKVTKAQYGKSEQVTKKDKNGKEREVTQYSLPLKDFANLPSQDLDALLKETGNKLGKDAVKSGQKYPRGRWLTEQELKVLVARGDISPGQQKHISGPELYLQEMAAKAGRKEYGIQKAESDALFANLPGKDINKGSKISGQQKSYIETGKEHFYKTVGDNKERFKNVDERVLGVVGQLAGADDSSGFMGRGVGEALLEEIPNSIRKRANYGKASLSSNIEGESSITKIVKNLRKVFIQRLKAEQEMRKEKEESLAQGRGVGVDLIAQINDALSSVVNGQKGKPSIRLSTLSQNISEKFVKVGKLPNLDELIKKLQGIISQPDQLNPGEQEGIQGIIDQLVDNPSEATKKAASPLYKSVAMTKKQLAKLPSTADTGDTVGMLNILNKIAGVTTDDKGMTKELESFVASKKFTPDITQTESILSDFASEKGFSKKDIGTIERNTDTIYDTAKATIKPHYNTTMSDIYYATADAMERLGLVLEDDVHAKAKKHIKKSLQKALAVLGRVETPESEYLFKKVQENSASEVKLEKDDKERQQELEIFREQVAEKERIKNLSTKIKEGSKKTKLPATSPYIHGPNYGQPLGTYDNDKAPDISGRYIPSGIYDPDTGAMSPLPSVSVPDPSTISEPVPVAAQTSMADAPSSASKKASGLYLNTHVSKGMYSPEQQKYIEMGSKKNLRLDNLGMGGLNTDASTPALRDAISGLMTKIVENSKGGFAKMNSGSMKQASSATMSKLQNGASAPLIDDDALIAIKAGISAMLKKGANKKTFLGKTHAGIKSAIDEFQKLFGETLSEKANETLQSILNSVKDAEEKGYVPKKDLPKSNKVGIPVNVKQDERNKLREEALNNRVDRIVDEVDTSGSGIVPPPPNPPVTTNVPQPEPPKKPSEQPSKKQRDEASLPPSDSMGVPEMKQVMQSLMIASGQNLEISKQLNSKITSGSNDKKGLKAIKEAIVQNKKRVIEVGTKVTLNKNEIKAAILGVQKAIEVCCNAKKIATAASSGHSKDFNNSKESKRLGQPTSEDEAKAVEQAQSNRKKRKSEQKEKSNDKKLGETVTQAQLDELSQSAFESFQEVKKSMAQNLKELVPAIEKYTRMYITGDSKDESEFRKAIAVLGQSKTEMVQKFGKSVASLTGDKLTKSFEQTGLAKMGYSVSHISKETTMQRQDESDYEYSRKMLYLLQTAGQTQERQSAMLVRLGSAFEKLNIKNNTLGNVADTIGEKDAKALIPILKSEVSSLIHDSSKTGKQSYGLFIDTEGSKGVSKTVSEFNKIQKSAMNAESNVGKLVKGVANRVLLYGGMSFALYGLISKIKEAIGTMAQFETSVVNVTKVMNPLIASTKAISEAAQELGQKYGQSILESANAMVVFAQQGKNTAETIKLAEVSMLAANTTTLQGAAATEAITAALKQFNIESTNSIKILDSWNEIENRTAVTSETLAKAVQQSGTAARMAGITFDELNGIVSAVGSATRESGSQIGRSLKFILSHLRTDEAVTALQNLNVAVFNTEGTYRSSYSILQDLAAQWKTLTNVQKTNVAISIAGTRRYNALLVMMDKWQDSLDATSMSIDSQGSSMKENVKVMDTYAKKVAQMKSSMESFYAKLGAGGGKAILGTFSGALKSVTDIANSMPESLTAVAASMAALFGGAAAITRGLSYSGIGQMVQKNATISSAGTLAKREIGARVREASGNKSMIFSRTGNEAASKALTHLQSETARKAIVEKITREYEKQNGLKSKSLSTEKSLSVEHGRVTKEIERQLILEEQKLTILSKTQSGFAGLAHRAGVFYKNNMMAMSAMAVAANVWAQTQTDSNSSTGKTLTGDVVNATSQTALATTFIGEGAFKLANRGLNRFASTSATANKYIAGIAAAIAVIGVTSSSWKDVITNVEEKLVGSEKLLQRQRAAEDERLKTLKDSLNIYERMTAQMEKGSQLSVIDTKKLDKAKQMLLRLYPELENFATNALLPEINESALKKRMGGLSGLDKQRRVVQEQYASSVFRAGKGGLFGGGSEFDDISKELQNLKKERSRLVLRIKGVEEGIASEDNPRSRATLVRRRDELQKELNSNLDLTTKNTDNITNTFKPLVQAVSKEIGLKISSALRRQSVGSTANFEGYSTNASTDLQKLRSSLGGDEVNKRIESEILSTGFGGQSKNNPKHAIQLRKELGLTVVGFEKGIAKAEDKFRKFAVTLIDLNTGVRQQVDFEADRGLDKGQIQKIAEERVKAYTKGALNGYEDFIHLTDKITDKSIVLPVSSLKKFGATFRSTFQTILDEYSGVTKMLKAPLEFEGINVVSAENSMDSLQSKLDAFIQYANNTPDSIGKLSNEFSSISDSILSSTANIETLSGAIGHMNKILAQGDASLAKTIEASQIALAQTNITRVKVSQLTSDYIKAASNSDLSPVERARLGDDEGGPISSLAKVGKDINDILKAAGVQQSVQEIAGTKQGSELRDAIQGALGAAQASITKSSVSQLNSAEKLVRTMVTDRANFAKSFNSTIKSQEKLLVRQARIRNGGSLTTGDIQTIEKTLGANKTSALPGLQASSSNVREIVSGVGGQIDRMKKVLAELRQDLAKARSKGDTVAASGLEQDVATTEKTLTLVRNQFDLLNKSASKLDDVVNSLIIPSTSLTNSLERLNAVAETRASQDIILKGRGASEKIAIDKINYQLADLGSALNKFQIQLVSATPEEQKQVQANISEINKKQEQLLKDRRKLEDKQNVITRRRVSEQKRAQAEFYVSKTTKSKGTLQSQKALYDAKIKDAGELMVRVAYALQDADAKMPKRLKDTIENSMASVGKAIRDIEKEGDPSYRKNMALASSQEKAAASYIESLNAQGQTLEQIFSDAGLKELAKTSPLIGQLADKIAQQQENDKLTDAGSVFESSVNSFAKSVDLLLQKSQNIDKDVTTGITNAQEMGGFSSGGYTGGGGLKDIAGVVHRGEYVVPAHMKELFPMLESMRMGTKDKQVLLDAVSSGSVPGFAKGGLVDKKVLSGLRRSMTASRKRSTIAAAKSQPIVGLHKPVRQVKIRRLSEGTKIADTAVKTQATYIKGLKDNTKALTQNTKVTKSESIGRVKTERSFRTVRGESAGRYVSERDSGNYGFTKYRRFTMNPEKLNNSRKIKYDFLKNRIKENDAKALKEQKIREASTPENRRKTDVRFIQDEKARKASIQSRLKEIQSKTFKTKAYESGIRQSGIDNTANKIKRARIRKQVGVLQEPKFKTPFDKTYYESNIGRSVKPVGVKPALSQPVNASAMFKNDALDYKKTNRMHNGVYLDKKPSQYNKFAKGFGEKVTGAGKYVQDFADKRKDNFSKFGAAYAAYDVVNTGIHSGAELSKMYEEYKGGGKISAARVAAPSLDIASSLTFAGSQVKGKSGLGTISGIMDLMSEAARTKSEGYDKGRLGSTLANVGMKIGFDPWAQKGIGKGIAKLGLPQLGKTGAALGKGAGLLGAAETISFATKMLGKGVGFGADASTSMVSRENIGETIESIGGVISPFKTAATVLDQFSIGLKTVYGNLTGMTEDVEDNFKKFGKLDTYNTLTGGAGYNVDGQKEQSYLTKVGTGIISNLGGFGYDEQINQGKETLKKADAQLKFLDSLKSLSKNQKERTGEIKSILKEKLEAISANTGKVINTPQVLSELETTIKTLSEGSGGGKKLQTVLDKLTGSQGGLTKANSIEQLNSLLKGAASKIKTHAQQKKDRQRDFGYRSENEVGKLLKQRKRSTQFETLAGFYRGKKNKDDLYKSTFGKNYEESQEFKMFDSELKKNGLDGNYKDFDTKQKKDKWQDIVMKYFEGANEGLSIKEIEKGKINKKEYLKNYESVFQQEALSGNISGVMAEASKQGVDVNKLGYDPVQLRQPEKIVEDYTDQKELLSFLKNKEAKELLSYKKQQYKLRRMKESGKFSKDDLRSQRAKIGIAKDAYGATKSDIKDRIMKASKLLDEWGASKIAVLQKAIENATDTQTKYEFKDDQNQVYKTINREKNIISKDDLRYRYNKVYEKDRKDRLKKTTGVMRQDLKSDDYDSAKDERLKKEADKFIPNNGNDLSRVEHEVKGKVEISANDAKDVLTDIIYQAASESINREMENILRAIEKGSNRKGVGSVIPDNMSIPS